MNKLRTEINKILKSIHPTVYHIDVKNKTGYPYLVYDLGRSYFEDGLEVFPLDIDIWDHPQNDDATEIEILAQTVWNELNSCNFINDDMQFSIYRQTRFTVDEDEPGIKRRTLLFTLRYYDRSVN